MTTTLFEIDQTTSPEAPRCRMCARPARWMSRRGSHAPYCSGSNCDNRERLCQSCGGPFLVNADGAGTKYCSVTCRATRHSQVLTQTGRLVTAGTAVLCAWCKGVTQTAYGRGRGFWPAICAPCLEPIKHLMTRLKDHHVPHERARELLNDPGCEVCGRDVVVKVLNSTTGKARSLLVVDHDHSCCPAESKSCGRCVRGLICSPCNSAAGLLQEDSHAIRALAAYLDRWNRTFVADAPTEVGA